MNELFLQWQRALRTRRARRNPENCRRPAPQSVRYRAPRPRTILAQFVGHQPETSPLRVASFRQTVH